MRKIAILVTVLAFVAGAAGFVAPLRTAAQSDDALRQLPDGIGVVSIDVQKVTSSDLWASVAEKSGASKALGEIQSGLADLGLKLTDLKTVTVAIPPSKSYGIAAIVNGSFVQDDLLARLRGNAKVKLTSETYKGVAVFRVEETSSSGKKDDVSFSFFDAGTILIGSTTGVHAGVDVKTGEKPSLAQNDKITGGLSEASAGAVRFAFALPPGFAGALKSSTVPLPDFSTVSLIFGTVGIASGIDLNATLRNDTAEHAKAMANQLYGLLAMAKGFLGASSDPKMAPLVDAIKNITITDSNADVKISGSLPKEALAKIIH